MAGSIRYFTTFHDILEMQIGDQIHRTLSDDIDDKITHGVMGCAIAIDMWEDRPSTTTRRPRVLDGKSRHQASCWPISHTRYDFDFADDCVTQITKASDLGESVAGMTYKLKLMNIQQIREPTASSLKTDRKRREAQSRNYGMLIQTWIDNGRMGPEPVKPSHMRGSHHVAIERIRALEENHLPHTDAHAEMWAKKRNREKEKEQQDTKIQASKRQAPRTHK